MTLKLFEITKSAERIVYVVEKKQEFFKSFRKFVRNLDVNLTHNIEFSEFGSKSNDEASSDYGVDVDIKEYVDRIFHFSNGGKSIYSIDVVFGKDRIFIIIYTQEDKQNKISKLLNKFGRF